MKTYTKPILIPETLDDEQAVNLGQVKSMILLSLGDSNWFNGKHY